MQVVFLQFLGALVLTLISREFAQKAGVVDKPGVLKIHRKPVPYLGGVAIALAVFIGCAINRIKLNQSFLLFGLLFLLLGLWDDLKTIKAKTRFFIESILTLVFVFTGYRIPSFPLLSYVLSWLVVMGAINSVNWIDGMDGLLGGIAVIVSLGFWTIAKMLGHPWLPSFIAVFSVSILGFLVLNLHPAKIFLGDAGSYLIGFTLAYISIELLRFRFSWNLFAAVLALLGIFIVDSTIAIIRRIRLKRHPFKGDRSHIYDQFYQATDKYWGTVLLMYGIAAIGVSVGLLTFNLSSPYNFIFWISSVIIVYGLLFVLGFASERFVSKMRKLKEK